MDAGLPREHYFATTTAKFVFRHRQHGVVLVRDPISLGEAAKYGLTPVLIYALAPKGLPLRYLSFTAADRPEAFATFLQRAWRGVGALRGLPDVLSVSRHVAAACPGLQQALARVGVTLTIAAGTDRKFSAFLRNIQNDALRVGRVGAPETPVNSLEALNSAAGIRLDRDVAHENWRPCDRELDEAVKRWLALPVVPLAADLPAQPWTAGPWLHAWEASLPPSPQRYLHQGDGAVWLLIEDAAAAAPLDNAAEKAKLMVDAWPNPPVEIARALGTTTRELQWFLSERAGLEDHRFALLELLGVEYDASYGEYEAAGPCVLIARNRRQARAAYDELGHGGDVAFAFEAVPEKGAADPSWRFLLFMACGGLPNVIMVPRGGEVDLDDKTFLNFTGLKAVPADLYRDIVATSARACLSPERNVPEMMAFAARRYDQLSAAA